MVLSYILPAQNNIRFFMAKNLNLISNCVLICFCTCQYGTVLEFIFILTIYLHNYLIRINIVQLNIMIQLTNFLWKYTTSSKLITLHTLFIVWWPTMKSKVFDLSLTKHWQCWLFVCKSIAWIILFYVYDQLLVCYLLHNDSLVRQWWMKHKA